MPDDPQNQQGSDERKSSGLDQFAKYSELALVMPAGMAGGWLIGAWIDHQFHTEHAFLVGIVLGFVGGFLHIFRVAMRGVK